MPSPTHASCILSLFLVAVTPCFSQEKKAKAKEPLRLAAVKRDVLRAPSAPPAGWTLRDDEGREVEANLVSAHGEIVKIQRLDDEREFDVPISMFDSETEQMIRHWIEVDPEAVDYSLELRASREMVDSSEFEIAGRYFKKVEWTYHITLANQTRNELNDAQIEYRIVFDDNVAITRTTAMPGKGKNQQDGQAVDLPGMQFNDEIEFKTPVIETETYEYKPTRGDRDFLRDEVKGIWIRVVRHGEVIAEYKSNQAAMGDLSWDNEDEIEITITNRFRDSFEEEE